MPDLTPAAIVAIPVCNEAERIAGCLEALDGQVGAQFAHIVLLLNNCVDGSADIARRIALRPGTRLNLIERHLPPPLANAGHARRLAMLAAAALAGPDDVLLTSDADAQVDPDWLAANLAAIAQGADVVAGWVELDPIEWGRIPTHLHEDDARECAYDKLCDAIHARLDPDPADPLPRHTQHSGASIAVTMAAYGLTDGIPDVPSGEDRAFMAALRRAGARVRHAPEVHVMVSGRIDGRCVGGMADTIRRRLERQDDTIDDRLEPAWYCARRAFFRGRLRAAYDDPTLLACLAKLLDRGHEGMARCAGLPFEAAWDALEAHCLPRPRTVRVVDLARQTAAAESILLLIRAGLFSPGDRSDTARLAPADLE